MFGLMPTLWNHLFGAMVGSVSIFRCVGFLLHGLLIGVEHIATEEASANEALHCIVSKLQQIRKGGA